MSAFCCKCCVHHSEFCLITHRHMEVCLDLLHVLQERFSDINVRSNVGFFFFFFHFIPMKDQGHGPLSRIYVIPLIHSSACRNDE